MSLADRIKSLARELGFDRVGIAPAEDADGFERLGEWLARGFAGDMAYMHNHADARRRPASIVPDVKSVVMVALNYRQPTSGGPIAQYARGADYHDVIRDKLNRLLAMIREERPDIDGRGVVDTAPLLERDFARRAGIGWIGKNTMLIHPKLGSFFFLGALLLNVELPVDEPFAKNHCGTCTRCLDACPTDAFPAAGWLDSRRCISYLTIEHRGPIDESLRSGLGEWVFGCDICQDVCPWNLKAPMFADVALTPREGLVAVDLLELVSISEEQFRQRFRGTPLFRTKRRGLVRNVALALGNSANAAALEPLSRLLSDADGTIRDAAAWAIAAIGERAQSAAPNDDAEAVGGSAAR